VLDNHHVLELNALVMDFALPALLFVAMVTTGLPTFASAGFSRRFRGSR
jgi:hypothetical protein